MRFHPGWYTLLQQLTLIFKAGAGSSIALGFPSMLRDLHGTEEEGAATLRFVHHLISNPPFWFYSSFISLFGLGFGVVPLLTAPLSEDLGRRPLFIASIIIFALIHVVAAEWAIFISSFIHTTNTILRQSQEHGHRHCCPIYCGCRGLNRCHCGEYTQTTHLCRFVLMNTYPIFLGSRCCRGYMGSQRVGAFS